MATHSKRASSEPEHRSHSGQDASRNCGAAGPQRSAPEKKTPRVPNVSDEVAQDAIQHLIEKPEHRKLMTSMGQDRIALLRDRIVNGHSLSREQHLELISDAYALFAAMKKDDTLRAALLNAAKAMGRKVNARTSVIRLLVEMTISYGGGVGGEQRRRAGKLYSRDAAAITNLAERGIMPSGVKELSQQKGEGLDFWAKPSSVGAGAAGNADVDRPPGQTEASNKKMQTGLLQGSDDQSDKGSRAARWTDAAQSGEPLRAHPGRS